jgi:hypothetical protein
MLLTVTQRKIEVEMKIPSKKSRAGKKPRPPSKPRGEMFLSPEHVRALPVGVFYTVRGPLIGHVLERASQAPRLYAPALLNLMGCNAVFLPMAFVESYIDVNMSMILGRLPPTAFVVAGYKTFVAEFEKGAYVVMPVTSPTAEIPGDPVSVVLPGHEEHTNEELDHAGGNPVQN